MAAVGFCRQFRELIRVNLVVFKREILKSLEKVAGKGGVQKIF
jgi:hypothetical protein